MDCDIYYSIKLDAYVVTQKGVEVPYHLRARGFFDGHFDTHFREPDIVWKYLSSQEIITGAATQPPIEGLSPEKIFYELRIQGYVYVTRVINDFDTVVLEFDDEPNRKNVFVIVPGDASKIKNDPILYPMACEGEIISKASPIGKAIQMAKLNDVVEIKYPYKIRYATIKDIRKSTLSAQEASVLRSRSAWTR